MDAVADLLQTLVPFGRLMILVVEFPIQHRCVMIEIPIPVLVLIIPCFFLWSAIHELSHLVVAKLQRDYVVRPSFKLYPHIDEVSQEFRWASISWEYPRDPKLSGKEFAAIMLAPRVLGLIAAIALPFACLLPELWMISSWLTIWGCGLIDLAYGSIGFSANSDLRVAALNLNISPWILRIAGWSVAIVSVAITITLLVIS